jgi:hypothetical protein
MVSPIASPTPGTGEGEQCTGRMARSDPSLEEGRSYHYEGWQCTDTYFSSDLTKVKHRLYDSPTER